MTTSVLPLTAVTEGTSFRSDSGIKAPLMSSVDAASTCEARKVAISACATEDGA